MRVARTALWIGAFFDALNGIQLLLPVSFAVAGFSGLREPGPAGQIAFGSGVLMLGWSALELWAAHAPRERVAVMYVGLGVLVVYLVDNLARLVSETAEASTTLPIVAIQIGLGMLFVFALAALRRDTVPYPTSAST